MPENPLKEKSFEEALARLEEVVQDLECGQIDLQDSLSRYEEGIMLLKRCYGQLTGAEKRILELMGQDEAGNPVTRPFDHRPSAERKS